MWGLIEFLTWGERGKKMKTRYDIYRYLSGLGLGKAYRGNINDKLLTEVSLDSSDLNFFLFQIHNAEKVSNKGLRSLRVWEIIGFEFIFHKSSTNTT